MKIKTILVNNRYLIYMDDGCVYDTKEGKDIPQEVFDLRDKILNN
jgi:hypothetical protein